MRNFKKELRKIQSESENRLELWLVENILDSDEPEAYLKDIVRIGCKNGIISELIYYKDIYPFFDEYYQEIQELLLDYQSNFGNITIEPDMKSQFTWLAIEMIAYDLEIKLELD